MKETFKRALSSVFESGALHQRCASHLGHGDLASYFLDYHHVTQHLDAVNEGLAMLPAEVVLPLRAKHAALRKSVSELHTYVE